MVHMRLTVVTGGDAGRSIPVVGHEFRVGRDPDSNLVLSDVKVSRRHAYFRTLSDGRIALYDRGSSNGTYVNGHRITSSLLNGGEQVRFGDTLLDVTQDGEAATAIIAQPGGQFQVAAPAGQRSSAIQRIVLQRSLRRATIVGVVLCVLVATVAALFATGVLPVDEGEAAPLSSAEVVDLVAPSTVFVLTDAGVAGVGRGSGWVLDAEEGLIVTNAHVTTAPGSASYSVATGPEVNITEEGEQLVAGDEARSADLLGEALCEDIAVLQVENPSGLRSMALLESQSGLAVGQEVVAVGYPATLNLSGGGGFTQADLAGNTGVVSVPETTFESVRSGGIETGPYLNVVLTDTVINEGNSGGPLVDYEGRLVGMNSAGRGDVQGQNYAIGVDRLREMIPEIQAGEDVC